MKITKTQLRKIIKEELEKQLTEASAGFSIETNYPELAKALNAMGKAEGAEKGKELVWMSQWLERHVSQQASAIFNLTMFSGGRSMLQAANDALRIGSDEGKAPKTLADLMQDRYVGSRGVQAPKADDQNVTKGTWR